MSTASQSVYNYCSTAMARQAAPQIGTGTITVGRILTFPISGTITDLDRCNQRAEYWPYDPGDGGGPIYNSATGEQLRGFPS
jgi:hypothetical protein